MKNIKTIVYQGKVTSSQLNYTKKFTLKLLKSRSKKNSKIIPNLLNVNGAKMLKEYWENKIGNFFPHVNWSIIRECPL